MTPSPAPFFVRACFLNRHVILNGTKWSEESLNTLPTQAVFGPDKITFRPRLQGFFASLRMTWPKKYLRNTLLISLWRKKLLHHANALRRAQVTRLRGEAT